MWIVFWMVATCGAGAELVLRCKDGTSNTHVSLWNMKCGPGGCYGQEQGVRDTSLVSEDVGNS